MWGSFLLAVSLLRDFFFIIFMTFLLCYAIRGVTGWLLGWLSPQQDRPGLERGIVAGCLVGLLIALVGFGNVLGPKIVSQAQELVGRVHALDAEREFFHLLDQSVGAYLFRRAYGGPSDPRYQAGLKQFAQAGASASAAYQDFPRLEAAIRGGFEHTFEQESIQRLRAQLATQGTQSLDFDAWFLSTQAPVLLRRNAPTNATTHAIITQDAPPTATDPTAAKQLLAELKRDPVTLAGLKQEWKEAQVAQQLAKLKQSPAYTRALQAYYTRHHEQNPTGVPYAWETYVRLDQAYAHGLNAFAEVLREADPAQPGKLHKQAAASFEATKQRELVQAWWTTGSAAVFIRTHVSTHLNGLAATGVALLQDSLGASLAIPVQLATALLLSFFILFDFRTLKYELGRLQDSRLGPFYDEIAPELVSFSELLGRSFGAQGLVAVCNAGLTFLALTLLGIEHALVLAAVVFLFSFVPVLGVILSGLPIAVVAVIQPGGSLWLALQALAAIVVIHLIETSILNPRIVGKLLHLHPVLVLVVLLLAEHFLGLWGLLLGIPLAAYLFSFVFLDEGMGESEGLEATDALAEAAGAARLEAKPEAQGAATTAATTATTASPPN